MTRRSLSLLVVVAVLCSCMTVTAYAADNEGAWIQVLEYSTINDSGSNYFVVKASQTISLPLPQRTYCVWIDMLVNTSDNPITSAYSLWNGNKTQLTVSKLGDKLCRIYGRMSYHTYEQLQLEINCSGTGYYELLSCRVSNMEHSTFAIRGKVQGNSNQKVTVEQKDSSTSAVVWFNQDSDTYGYSATWETMIWSADNWRVYDSLSFALALNVKSISSITAYHNGLSLPVTVSPILSGSGDANTGNLYHVEVTIDLTGLDRTSNIIPYIYLTGESDLSGYEYLQLLRTTGYVESESVNPLTYYFNKLFGKLEQYFGGDSTDSNDFQEEAAQQGQEMDDLNNQLQGVTKPPVDDIQTSVDSYVSPFAISVFTEQFSLITGNSLTTTMLVMSLTVALVAYILFGKR